MGEEIDCTRLHHRFLLFMGPPEIVHGKRVEEPEWLNRRRLEEGEAIRVVKETQDLVGDKSIPASVRRNVLYHNAGLLADMAMRRQKEEAESAIKRGEKPSKAIMRRWSDHYTEGLRNLVEFAFAEREKELERFWKQVVREHQREGRVIPMRAKMREEERRKKKKA